ncbi:AsnC family transcriptional regulator [Yoonia sediminilitoris]|uniref:AsnC family transcriptional regulator n=1 Tax=Yoonia sediminilitoris TaxID=1286148 RepID=A0A2T6KIG3_9RHOB|nr:AsnC family transcriptional regulator [Yoonia sediminilitoris]RCW96108.1 AsnC family transcriptional regulator [Yoonia sediminilitoris]
MQILGMIDCLLALSAVEIRACYSFLRRITRQLELDSIDRRILAVLQKTGRISNAELSEVANLSASACHRRVQRLEKDGYIRDYVALLDIRKMGLPTTVFVEITLSGQANEVLDAFERAVARIPDVLECHLMAGTADYLLKVVARDTDDFARIHRRYLATLPGVAQMQSSFALRTVRQTTALPVS